MPCMGPSYSDRKADEATEEIILLLATKYNVLSFPLHERDKKMWQNDRNEAYRQMKDAVHNMFKLDCYEAF